MSQSKLSKNVSPFLLIALMLTIMVFSACNSSTSPPTDEPTSKKKAFIEGYGNLAGEQKALDLAEKMLAALGGREKWTNIKALNYKEKVDQKGIDTTYTSENWLDLEQFNSKLERKGTTFHNFLSINEQEGQAHDLTKDRAVTVRPDDMIRFKYADEHNLYKIIKRLAIGDTLNLKMRNALHFDVITPDSVMLGGFNLDPQNFPEYFSSRIYNQGKNEKIMHFTGWKSKDGVFYPADGETIDRTMTFIMDTWEPLMEPLDVAFPDLDASKTK